MPVLPDLRLEGGRFALAHIHETSKIDANRSLRWQGRCQFRTELVTTASKAIKIYKNGSENVQKNHIFETTLGHKSGRRQGVMVSVLMSVYNSEKWLSESIESILEQTYRDFEFIIVNDGSTDSSIEILQKYAALDKRIKIINKQNTGLADSLNVGMNKALGKWIARIDADDIAGRSRIEIQQNAAEQSIDVLLLGSGNYEIDEAGTIKAVRLYPNENNKLIKHLQNLKGFFAHSSAFFNRAVAVKIGGYRARIKRAEDYDLWLRMSRLGDISCVKEPLVSIRKHGKQISNECGGLQQMIDAHLALASHIIVKNGVNDPLELADDNELYRTFRETVEQAVHETSILHATQFARRLKETKSENIGAMKYTAMIKHITANLPLAVKQLERHLLGDRLARQVAKDWIRTRST